MSEIDSMDFELDKVCCGIDPFLPTALGSLGSRQIRIDHRVPNSMCASIARIGKADNLQCILYQRGRA